MKKILIHVVAGYPDFDQCIELVRGMERVGVGMIEVQIPFSDPTADGETIMQANDIALARGMTVEASFDLIKQADLKVDIYIMSYFQKVLHFGLEKFCEMAASVGAKGLIIPDLPYDATEFAGLCRAAKKNNLSIVPVISPGMSSGRLKDCLKNAEDLIYLTSMKGITGKNIKVNTELTNLARKIKEINPNSQLAIGFGISNRKDLTEVLKIADIGVIGSAVIRQIDSGGIDNGLKFVKSLV